MQTLVEMLRWRATYDADQIAFTFLVDGDAEEAHITYGELDRQARAIGALLQRRLAPGDRAVLLYQPGLDYVAGFFGCLYAGVIAVPAYPPNPVRPKPTLPRIQTIVSDSQARVALTNASLLARTPSLFELAPELSAPEWLATETLEPGIENDWKEPDISSDSLAFLQYTSGSTGKPRGVMVSHGNLLHNSQIISEGFSSTSEDSGMIWLPPYHDMGLIGGLIQPIWLGARTVLISPAAFLQRPFRWLQAISRYRTTLSGGPNFAYDLALRRVTPEQKATLDLSCWKVAFNGAEPVRAHTLREFASAFASCGFRPEAHYPCYGLAEGTLIVTGGVRNGQPPLCTVESSALEKDQVVITSEDQPGAHTLVSSGRALRDVTVVIADPETMTRCQKDQIGEIWVAGPSVAKGYWNRPEETQHTFQARLTDTGEGPFMRTGDLGFLRDGELFVTGRLKDLIIIDGRNHYPQDIEATAEQSHPEIRRGAVAAFSVDSGGQERLVIVAEVERTSRVHRQKTNGAESGADDAARAITEAVRRAVSENHDVRVHAVTLLRPGRIPLTSSGKIRRQACRAAFLDGTLENLEE
ncbi:MAG TPA: fatty acyl-AMP ligase [Blastocatellia bacterium]|nr:fatty acyl-AMP ligase [Blastocatellia bacterium]